MKGKYPREYFHNPNIQKPIEEIWDDIDAYSGEFFEDETKYHEKIDLFIPLAPLEYNGKTTKGILFSQGLEYILKLYPQLKEIFFCGAYTMWSSYSWCDKADFYLTCYENKKREEYYKNKYPNKKDIIFIPLQDADYTNEYRVAPTFFPQKLIDVICVSTPYEVKNLPFLAKTIRKYYEKYNKILKTAFVLGTKLVKKDENNNLDYSELPANHRKEMDEVIEILGDLKQHMGFFPFVENKDLTKYYTNSKCCVLTSLIEGKNRSLNEAMACNTPVITFKQHNQWARGDYPIFFGNSGELAPEFTPEALADTIHKVINNLDKYEPRKNYLKYNGRKNFINTLVKYIPYYKENIPDYQENRFHENLWVDLATQANYQLGYMEFLYEKNPAITHIRGISQIDSLIKFFYSRFHIK